MIYFLNPALYLLATNVLGPRSNQSIFENKIEILKKIDKSFEDSTFGNFQWVGYFHVFSALLGIFELTIMGNHYDLYSKVSDFTITMCLRNFGPSILRV